MAVLEFTSYNHEREKSISCPRVVARARREECCAQTDRRYILNILITNVIDNIAFDYNFSSYTVFIPKC